MVIYSTPELTDDDRRVLGAIDDLRVEMSFYLRMPRRWMGTLRRDTFARAVQGSNSIEGYAASVEDVAAVLDDEEPLEADRETSEAIRGYGEAMTYALRRAGQEAPVDVSLLLALHFMMTKYDLTKHPGEWRPGAVWVEDAQGDAVFEAPPRDDVEALVDELVGAVNQDADPPMVAAAMAHLNLVLIHPFSDGNGRMARCLQTYVLARDGVIGAEFSSIEEYLGRNTPAYYAVLAEVANGSWTPHRSARSWIRFCLTAHYRQALVVKRRFENSEALWDACDRLVVANGLAPRVTGPLAEVARGRRVTRSLYQKMVATATGEPITGPVATRDLRALVDADLLLPVGEKRGRRYEPSATVVDVWRGIQTARPPVDSSDPYELG